MGGGGAVGAVPKEERGVGCLKPTKEGLTSIFSSRWTRFSSSASSRFMVTAAATSACDIFSAGMCCTKGARPLRLPDSTKPQSSGADHAANRWPWGPPCRQ